MNKKILSLITIGSIILPSLTFAITANDMADAAAVTALYVASGIVVVLWVLTGILFLMAQGEPATLNKAKLALMASVIGTVVLIIANSGAGAFVGALFGIKGVTF